MWKVKIHIDATHHPRQPNILPLFLRNLSSYGAKYAPVREWHTFLLFYFFAIFAPSPKIACVSAPTPPGNEEKFGVCLVQIAQIHGLNVARKCFFAVLLPGSGGERLSRFREF